MRLLSGLKHSLLPAVLSIAVLAPSLMLTRSACAGGDDFDMLRERIERLESQRRSDLEEIRTLRRKIDELEGAVKAVPAEREPSGGMAAVKQKPGGLAERFKVYGDFRLRSELDTNRSDADDPRFRERIRFRIGADFNVFRDVVVGARMLTGNSDDPRSPHVNLGDGFGSFELSLDRAFIAYRPSGVPGLTLVGGKAGFPFVTKRIYNELIWDQDVQPEGFSAVYVAEDSGPLDGIHFVLGQYIVEQRGEEMSWLTAPQIAIRDSYDEWSVTSAVGLYLYYGHDLTPNGDTSLVRPPDNAGNATVDLDADGLADEFLSDFRILSVLMSVEYGGFHRPLILSGEYFHNFGAGLDEDDGFSLGVQLGKAATPHDWAVYYQFQLVQQDSIFTPFSQDDFLLSTNFLGHVAGLKYKLTERIGLHLWASMVRRDNTAGGLTDENRIRGRFDMNVRF